MAKDTAAQEKPREEAGAELSSLCECGHDVSWHGAADSEGLVCGGGVFEVCECERLRLLPREPAPSPQAGPVDGSTLELPPRSEPRKLGSISLEEWKLLAERFPENVRLVDLQFWVLEREASLLAARQELAQARQERDNVAYYGQLCDEHKRDAEIRNFPAAQGMCMRCNLRLCTTKRYQAEAEVSDLKRERDELRAALADAEKRAETTLDKAAKELDGISDLYTAYAEHPRPDTNVALMSDRAATMRDAARRIRALAAPAQKEGAK